MLWKSSPGKLCAGKSRSSTKIIISRAAKPKGSSCALAEHLKEQFRTDSRERHVDLPSQNTDHSI
jgi:hypothetical protein